MQRVAVAEIEECVCPHLPLESDTREEKQTFPFPAFTLSL